MIFPKNSSFHFLGIAGTAMAGAALLVKELGFFVQGSDEATYPPMSIFLEEQKIPVFTPYSEQNLPTSDDTYIVVGNAISRGNIELETALNRRLKLVSMPELLRFLILMPRKPIVISATHGKTTTTALTTHILHSCGINSGYLIGGISRDLNTNAALGTHPYFVIEGDEYDSAYFDKRSKFLHYVPYVVMILNIEFDHADIFNSIDEIELSFTRLINSIPSNGLLVYNIEDERVVKLAQKARCKKISFGLSSGDVSCNHFLETSDGIEGIFTLSTNEMFNFKLPLSGTHNLMNFLAAVALCDDLKLPIDRVVRSVKTFKGVARRLEILYDKEITVIDDFGHHPTAVKSTIEGLRNKYKDRRLLVVLDPRSNTSVRRVLQDDWVEALSNSDIVWINQLHRIDKIPLNDRLDRVFLVNELSKKNVKSIAVSNVEQILSDLNTTFRQNDVIVFFSNGSFDGIKEKFICSLSK